MALAAELGLRIPETRRLSKLADLLAWFSQPASCGVLKLDGTYGGKGVRLAHSPVEAERAFKELRRPQTFIAAGARWLAIKDSLAFWNLKHRAHEALTVQRLVPGRPANTMFVAREGALLAMLTVEVLCTEGMTGAALAVRPIENEEIKTCAERIARRLRLSGFHGLDFMLEEGTGDAYLIEWNPRCTQLGHLCLPDGSNLGRTFCEVFLGTPPAADPGCLPAKTTAFFPQALLCEQRSPAFLSAHLDVPWEEPRLVRELMRRDWRERSWAGRLFSEFRGKKRSVVTWPHETTGMPQPEHVLPNLR